MELKSGSFKITDIQALNMSVVNGNYHEQAIEWWENLEGSEVIEVYKKTGNFRLGGWGYDIGPTEDDVIDMYKEVFFLSTQLKKI